MRRVNLTNHYAAAYLGLCIYLVANNIANKIIRAGNFTRKDDINFSQSALYKAFNIYYISFRVREIGTYFD